MTSLEIMLNYYTLPALELLRADYSSFIAKIEPSVTENGTGYYTATADGRRDAQTLRHYQDVVIIIDRVLATKGAGASLLGEGDKMNGLLDPEAYERDANYYHDHDQRCDSVYIQGRKVRCCMRGNCFMPPHPASDQLWCAECELENWVAMTERAGIDEYASEQIAKWKRFAGQE